VTTNQVLLGVGLIVALAVGSQVLASRSSRWCHWAVAVILYDAGMSLNLRQLHGHTRRINPLHPLRVTR
jgi:NhaP-type Na+/H+ or K+/H+ antiporter